MDKLDIMFDKQKKLQLKMNVKYKNDQEYIEKMFIGIITELCEALENTNWKPWKKTNMANQKEFQKEIIDMWHFVINLTLISDMTPTDVFDYYTNKNKINNERQEHGY